MGISWLFWIALKNKNMSPTGALHLTTGCMLMVTIPFLTRGCITRITERYCHWAMHKHTHCPSSSWDNSSNSQWWHWILTAPQEEPFRHCVRLLGLQPGASSSSFLLEFPQCAESVWKQILGFTTAWRPPTLSTMKSEPSPTWQTSPCLHRQQLPTTSANGQEG